MLSYQKSHITALVALTLGLASCSETDVNDFGHNETNIVATVSSPLQSRTAVDGDPANSSTVGIMWTDGDELGVFDANGANHTRYVKLTEGTVAEAEFGSATGSSFMPKYAYYPYSADNDGRDITALTGTVAATQKVGIGNIPCDYKIGRVQDGTNKFVFQHIFSLVRVDLDAAGTVMEGDSLKYVKVTADGANIAGNFNFNLRQVDYSNVTNGSQTITVEWPEGAKLDKALQDYITVIPTIAAGTRLDFEIKTANYTATFSAASKVTFEAQQLYNFPLSLLDINKNYHITITDKDGNTVDLEPGNTTDPDPEPVVTTGTFTCAAMNIDGLSLKSGNAGSSGTTAIGQAIAKAGWDFFGVSEDFAYNKELTAALTEYKSGTFRGNVSIVGGKSQNTDGLNFFAKSNFSFANESWTKYNDVKGGLTDGADEYIQKGFRHYEVTVAEGAIIDVYITHMNTYSGSGNDESNAFWKAQMSQLRQLRDYVIEKAKTNKRPAIIMGDTNLRYTRHAIKEQFIDSINNVQTLTIKDPWVEFHRPDYPAFGGKSLMINSKYYSDEGKYNTTDDICCYDNNKGEVVDKIFYINVLGAPLQLKADYYKNDDSDNFVKQTDSHEVTGITYEDENFTLHENYSTTINKRWGLADHFPAVAGFTWTLTK